MLDIFLNGKNLTNYQLHLLSLNKATYNLLKLHLQIVCILLILLINSIITHKYYIIF